MAFLENSLISVTIEGNPTIGSIAFKKNGLDKSTIPSGLTYNQEVEYYQDNAQFVRLYASNPDFLALNHDTAYTDCIGAWNGSGYDPPCYVTSGYLINPAPVTVRYVDTDGTTLQPSEVKVSDIYPDYKLSSNPTTTLTPSSYYRVGESKIITAPDIAGYVLVSNPTQTLTLSKNTNTATFTYAHPIVHVQFATNTVSNNVVTNTTIPSTLSSALIRQSQLSVEQTSGKDTVHTAHLLAPDSVTAPSNVLLLGGASFTLRVPVGATVPVTYTLGAQTDLATLRIYKSHGATLIDITDSVTLSTQNRKTAITYSLTDGGLNDEDGMANGTIVDPLYVGVLGAASVGVGNLANTGQSLTILVGLSLAVVAIGGGVLYGTRRRHFSIR